MYAFLSKYIIQQPRSVFEISCAFLSIGPPWYKLDLHGISVYTGIDGD